jgi:PAS domain S-box-containing protein
MAWRSGLAPDPNGSPHAAGVTTGPGESAEGHTFLSTVPAGTSERRVALAVIAFSALVFVSAVPFARIPLARVPAFIPCYESALAINDLITAILLFGQFTRLRSRALLALASGYLFDAIIIVPHALTFPGVFSPTGLLAAGEQTTAWLYVFWHGGFPLFVLAYAFCRDREATRGPLRANATVAMVLAIAAVAAMVCAFTLLATAGMDLLPVIMRGNDYSLLVTTGVGPAVWMLSLVALIALWRRRERSVLDLWLMVVMSVWLLDVALSTIVGSTRFDLGFYAGRSYGLMAASFVLAVLLLETNALHGRLADAQAQLAERARELERRVRERTGELWRSNETLKAEVAERKHAEQELLRTRTFLDVIVESVPAMLLVNDAKDGKCMLLNRAGEELLGYDRSNLLGKALPEGLLEEDATKIDRQDRQARSSGKLHEMYEHRLATRNRGVRLVRTKRAPILDAGGREQFILTCSEDVTEQRRTEEQLRHAQKMNALGELTGGLAHDFNNLLAIVIGNLDILSESIPGDEQKGELIRDALGAALSGSELTRRLLAFARQQPLQPEPLDLNELITGISRLLARTLGDDVQIGLDLDKAILPIIADRVQLETAIANLANNARDAMRKGGRLIIATSSARLDQDYAAQHAELEPGTYVQMEVSDTGDGMTPEILTRIFEPFYTTKEVGKGTGLGLSMVFGFMKQSGGHINVYSEPGRGTTFRLYFRPADSKALALDVAAPTLQPVRHATETILVVEDNPKLRGVVVKQLTAIGFDVLEVDNAKAALQVLADRGCVDLVFSDVVMPGDMDGIALAREAMVRWPDSKVLLTSGFSGARLADVEGLGAHVRLLNKPYRKADLARAIRDILDDQSICAAAVRDGRDETSTDRRTRSAQV